MTTSANVTNFRIQTVVDGEIIEVGSHRQNHHCQTHWEDLLQFTPLEDHTITPWAYDANEDYWEGDTKSLLSFLLECKPCPIIGVPRLRFGLIYKGTADKAGWQFHEMFAETAEARDSVARKLRANGHKVKPIQMMVFVTSLKEGDDTYHPEPRSFEFDLDDDD